MPFTKLSPIAVLPFLLLAASVPAQPLPDSVARKVDSLFAPWNKTSSPGCAVGVVRNDSLIFAKGYGMANLEYGVPITPATIFHMASVSKQFTAYCIVLLARQGKLQLDDDIHKYLKWFPALTEKITIRNLLNHTSGVRDQWQLLAIAGTRLDDVITQDHIIKILANQRALNFKPGEKYLYCNSGFTMLAEIVKSVSGKSLRQFADSAIFKPLGMNSTHFHDDYTEIEKNRASSYNRSNGTGFANSILSYSTAGATSLFTNVEDLKKWVVNFYNPKSGDQADLLTLTQKAKTNNGKELSYAAGIVSDTYKGWARYTHGGSDAGFRTSISVLPELKMGFIVLCNLGDINAGGQLEQVANLFVHEKNATAQPGKQEAKEKNARLAPEDTLFLKKFTGDYISNEGVNISIQLKHDSLFYASGTNSYLLAKDSGKTFCMFYAPDITFKFGVQSKDTGISIVTPNDDLYVTKYTNKPANDKALMEYTGVYNCPELDCNYRIVLKEHQLYLTNNKYSDAKLTLAGADHLLNDNWWMDHLLVTRNKLNKITGFEVSTGRVLHLKFDKVQ